MNVLNSETDLSLGYQDNVRRIDYLHRHSREVEDVWGAAYRRTSCAQARRQCSDVTQLRWRHKGSRASDELPAVQTINMVSESTGILWLFKSRWCNHFEADTGGSAQTMVLTFHADVWPIPISVSPT